MKNKYIRHAHISEGKFREILKLFCADIPALTVSELTGVSVQSTQRLYDRLRFRILELAVEEDCYVTGTVYIILKVEGNNESEFVQSLSILKHGEEQYGQGLRLHISEVPEGVSELAYAFGRQKPQSCRTSSPKNISRQRAVSTRSPDNLHGLHDDATLFPRGPGKAASVRLYDCD